MKNALQQMIFFNRVTGLPISLYSDSYKLMQSIDLPDIPIDELGRVDLPIVIKNMSEAHETHMTKHYEHFLIYKVNSDKKKNHFILVIGPFKHFPYSQVKITSMMSEHHLNQKITKTHLFQYYYSLQNIRVESIPYLFQLIEILFDIEPAQFGDVSYELIDSDIIKKTMLEYMEIDFYHHNYFQEQRLMKNIFRSNNFQLSDFREFEPELGTVTEDHVRNAKNIFIITIGTLQRLAIENGLDPHESFTIGDAYLRKIESSTNISKLPIYFHDLARKFQKALNSSKRKNYSHPIYKALHYIDNNLSRKFTLNDVAEYVGLHSTYLSKLFKTEMKINFTDHVLNRRIEEAKFYLKHSNHTLTEISDILAFSSKSYFYKCFKKHTKITPTEYRNE